MTTSSSGPREAPRRGTPTASRPTCASAPAASRGRLLYENHCQGCHSAALHWRRGRLATDWASLKEQVRAWQSRGLLGWSEDEIADVTRHLGETVYRLPGSPVSAREVRR